MKTFLIALMTVLTAVLFQAGAAQAFDVRNGGIFSQEDARDKCPKTCQWYGGWNGQWTTLSSGMSVCGCVKPAEGGPNDVNAGPIWSQEDAVEKCPKATYFYGGWNGQWTNTRLGDMSVCGSNQNWH